MPSGFFVEVRVSKIVRDFFIASNGTNIVILKKHDFISYSIRNLLCLVPKNYKRLNPRIDCYLKINLVYLNRIGIDVKYRNYLDEIGQEFINKQLYLLFRETFYSFVYACVLSGKEQKQAINMFMTTYNLDCTQFNFDMLKKSWDRSKTKKIWKNSLTCVPQKKIIKN